MLPARYPPMAYYGLLMTAGLSAWLLLKRWRLEGWRAALLSLAGLAAAAGIGVLLAAVYLLPLMELTVRSTRQLSLSSVDTYPLQHFLYELIDQQPAPRFLWEGAPHYPWEGILTPGLTVLALALLALAVRWRQVWPLLLAIVIVAALAMGNSSPF